MRERDPRSVWFVHKQADDESDGAMLNSGDTLRQEWKETQLSTCLTPMNGISALRTVLMWRA